MTHGLQASIALSQSTTPETSQPWEEVPSMESSYPDITFPEHSSPENSARRNKEGGHEGLSEKHASGQDVAVARTTEPPSVTLSVFDSRLSRRSRSWALVSTLTINFFLPFVNGVMLGFGEIFARSLAAHFGWKIPGGAATAVGIGAANASKQERSYWRKERT